MQRTTHIIFGLFLFSILWSIFNIDWSLAAFVGLGAIFPDLDVNFLHRKLLHNLWAFAASSGAIFIYLNPAFALAFYFGCLSHLLADSLTPTGIWPLWPIQRKICWHRFAGITTGRPTEFVFALTILAATLFILFSKFISDLNTVLILTAAVTIGIGLKSRKWKL
jgi:inner membrane protein